VCKPKEEIMKQERRKEATPEHEQDLREQPPETQVRFDGQDSRDSGFDRYADSLRGKSDGEILSRYEF
jgi:hypothetical protein